MITVYIMRHGETDWNKEMRLQGKSDVPLNAFGRYLAEKTRDGMREISFDAIYTSPLKRARETAEIVSRGDIPVLADERLSEFGFGTYEGKSVSKGPGGIQDENFWNFFHAPELYKAQNGAEEIEAGVERFRAFFDALLNNPENDGKTFLISTHGAAMGAMVNRIFKGRDLAHIWHKAVPKNCGVYAFRYARGKAEFFLEDAVYYTDTVRPWKSLDE